MSYIGPVFRYSKVILVEKREMFQDKNYVVWRKIFSEGAKPIYKMAVGNSGLFYETSKLPADEGILADEVPVTRSVARGI
jgi:hypothetical protein